MTYNTKILAKVGREVLKSHPDIFTGIVDQWPKPVITDLSLISNYFSLFCDQSGIEETKLKGNVYKSCFTELKKVFVGAMVVMYGNPYLFNKEISSVLNQNRQIFSKMIVEVKFRYKKEEDFKLKVDHFILKITNNDKRAATGVN